MSLVQRIASLPVPLYRYDDAGTSTLGESVVAADATPWGQNVFAIFKAVAKRLVIVLYTMRGAAANVAAPLIVC